VAKTRTAYFCRECGGETARWAGQCPACRAWNTLVEEPAAARRRAREAPANGRAAAGPAPAPVRLCEVEGTEGRRWPTGLAEFDFVLGGGIVPGSVVLVGGEPGIGKSTILLQVAARLEAAGRSTLYVSGEESAHQVKLRADRLEEAAGSVTLLA
jgi:DNA repair protein RadA/Sms